MRGSKVINKNSQIINQTSNWGSNHGAVPQYSVDSEVHQMETQWSNLLIWKQEFTFSVVAF